MSETLKFPNGFISWGETHFEITSAIVEKVLNPQDRGIVYETEYDYGRGGLYDLARELTDKFENLYKSRQWEGDYFEVLDEFLKEEL